MSRDAEETTVNARRAPLYITRTRGSQSLADFVVTHRRSLGSKLTAHGAILFRGFDVHSPPDFAGFVAATGLSAMDYHYGSTPRKLVRAGIYTSTEYPPNREIPLHSENAYSNRWPRSVAFCCIVPAAKGGETPVADLRDVVNSLGPALMDRFEQAGVQYVRHFHDGIDLSWQATFQTTDPAEMARVCEANGIHHDWVGDRGRVLRTMQTCQGVAWHPRTSERLFFNQAHLFHATSVGPEALSVMREEFGADQLPRHSRYGDHSEIPDGDIARIHAAFQANALSFSWQRGDVLWIDNMQIAHGRKPFQGERLILAALLDPSDAPLDEAPG